VIFVTVGTQMPFDRLVEVIDSWAGESKEKVIAQVGATRRRFQNLESTPFLGPSEIKARISSARMVIAHAGMGTILSAMAARKPLLVLPRRLEYREVTSDHQMATARRLSERGLVDVAWDVSQLERRLDRLSEVEAAPAIEPAAPVAMLDAVRDFLR
jgi:UDP-N-acetylglucosamine transferase subunit ALG13